MISKAQKDKPTTNQSRVEIGQILSEETQHELLELFGWHDIMT